MLKAKSRYRVDRSGFSCWVRFCMFFTLNRSSRSPTEVILAYIWMLEKSLCPIIFCTLVSMYPSSTRNVPKVCRGLWGTKYTPNFIRKGAQMVAV